VKLLVYGLNHWPEKVGIGRYTGELVAWLAARGHRVQVVTAPPYYPDWRIWHGWRRFWWQRERHDGALVWRAPLYVPRRPTGKKRALHLVSFALSSLPVALWQALFFRPQVVFAVAPAIPSAPMAWLAAKAGGARAWLHIQDFELDAAFGLGLVQGGWLKRRALAFERCLLRRFQRVSTISPRMVERLAAKGVAEQRRVLFPNWVDCREIRPLPARPQGLAGELQLPPGRRIALYSGNLGEKQGVEILVAAARLLAGRSDLLFLIVGEGAARERLETAAAGLGSVLFRPLVAAEQLNELLNLAAVHLLPQRADAADLVLPSKLAAMLASARPIVATAASGTGVALAVEGAGLVVPPGDATAFAAAIAELLDDPALARRHGERGRERALAEWDREAILLRFEAALEDLAAPRLVRRERTR
jgi:colanic acid biosynthesis glycosyl transferase WcaI